MSQSRVRTTVRTVLRVARDLFTLMLATARPHAQLAAENLFLRKQLALYMERDVKPRRADDATRIALVALSWLIDWRGLLTVVTPKTFNRWHRKGFRLFWRWEVEATWTAPCTDRAPAAYRGDGDRESHVGRGTDCFGTLVEARYSRVVSHGQALHARRRFTQEGCAVVDVEHLRAQSRQRRAGV
jgi:hypothetical protein